MQIKTLIVKKLFGVFDYKIPLNTDRNITIIHGPNGFGKTAILRLLSNFFNAQYAELEKTAFERFRIVFDDNSQVEIVRQIEQPEKPEILLNFYDVSGKKQEFLPKLTIKRDAIVAANLEIRIPGLERIGVDQWLDLNLDETLTFEEAVKRYWPEGAHAKQDPEWLKEIKHDIPVRLIESQRLLNFVSSHRSRGNINRPPMLSTVSAYSEELAELMQEKFKEYGATSQSLDRSFPLRIMQKEGTADVTEDQLQEQLSNIESTRAQLTEVGLLDKEENYSPPIQPHHMDKSTRNTLSVYVEDVERKLDVFAETASKIDLLRKIINRKFSYSKKEISFSKEKGFVIKTHYASEIDHSNDLSPNDLSSGEQHELVLLYELLFKVKSNALVLIDEPELSLHVTWQSQFLEDLQEIMALTDLSVLMATHSPDIIQDRWDLAVSLPEDAREKNS